MYTFSFWGCYDQAYIDTLCNKFCFFAGDILEDVLNMGFDLQQITSSPNPVIIAIFDNLINELIDDIDQHDLTSNLLDNIREYLQDNQEINAMCSSLSTVDCFDYFKNQIQLEIEHDNNQITIDSIKSIFDKYNC